MHRGIQRRAACEHHFAAGLEKFVHHIHDNDGRAVGVEREGWCGQTLFGKSIGGHRVSWCVLREDAASCDGWWDTEDIGLSLYRRVPSRAVDAHNLLYFFM